MPLGDTPYRRACPDRFRRVARSVDAHAALVYAHLCLGRASSPIGLCEVEVDILAADTHSKPADVQRALVSLSRCGAVTLDGAWVYVSGWIADDKPNNRDHAGGIYREITRLGAGSAGKSAHVDLCSVDKWGVVPTVPPPSMPGGVDHRPTLAPQTETYTETCTETETENETPCALPGTAPEAREGGQADAAKTKRKAFVPPEAWEVDALFEAKRIPDTQTDLFMAHYEANGWKVGRNPMKSWQAAVAGWATRYVDGGGKLVPEPVQPVQPQTPLFSPPKRQPCPVCGKRWPMDVHLSADFGCPKCEGVKPEETADA